MCRRRSRIVAPSSGAAPCPTPTIRESARADPRRRPRPWRRRGPRRQRPRRWRPRRWTPRRSTQPSFAPRATASTRGLRRALDQAIDHVTRFAETQRPTSTRTEIAPGIEIERRWDPLAQRRRLRPGRLGAVPELADHDRRPGARRRSRARRRRQPGRPRRRHEPRPPRRRPACSRSMPSSSPVAPRPIGALAYGLPDAGLAPVDRIVGPGNAWVTAAKIEVCGEVGIDLPAGPSEGLVLAAPPAEARRVALDLLTQAEHGPDSPAILVTTDAEFADAVEREVGALLDDGVTPRHPRPLARRARPDRARPGPRRRDRVRQRLRARAPLGRCRAARGRPSLACATPARCSSARGRPSRRATTRRARTTCCRPAAWLARRARSRSRALASSSRSSGSPATAWRASPRPSRPWPRRRACSSTAMPSPAASSRPPPPTTPRHRPMSPTPVTFTLTDRARLVQLGGDRRGGLGALRRARSSASSAST